MTRRPHLLALVIAGVAAGTGAARAEGPAWPASATGRLEVLALIQTLNATLLAARSATFTLDGWCADHRMAADPKIVATQRTDIDKPAGAETRARLAVGPDEPVKYRRVLLSCGSRVLSEADNWYVPGRLTPEMNRLLETTTTPFGRAVADLKPFRRTVSAELLWSPLPAGWETSGKPIESSPGALAIPERLFEHRAVLYDPASRPFSEVVETYRSDILAFPPPER